MLSTKSILLSGAAFAGIAVAVGAFGAHALKPLLAENNSVEVYNLAAQYQFYHALALLVTGILGDRANQKSLFGWAGFCFIAGILLFSGSLYVLATTQTHSVVFLTPLGGVFFLAGWIMVVVAIAKNYANANQP